MHLTGTYMRTDVGAAETNPTQHDFPGVSLSIMDPAGTCGVLFPALFLKKASVGEVDARPVGPSHAEQRLSGRIITRCIWRVSHTPKIWSYSGLKLLMPKLNKRGCNWSQRESRGIDYTLIKLISYFDLVLWWWRLYVRSCRTAFGYHY